VIASESQTLPEEMPLQSYKRRYMAWAYFALLFILSMYLFTKDNNFPMSFHPDEPMKARQIQGKKNFRFSHPLLLLGSVKLAMIGKHHPSAEKVVRVGRDVSAFFAALSVVFLAAAAFSIYGFGAGLAVGIACMLCSALLMYAHYLKEDTALMAGLALAFLAVAVHERRPSTRTIALLSLGFAMATSGKMIGLVSILLILPALLLVPMPMPRAKRIFLFLAFCIPPFLLFNYLAIGSGSAFVHGLTKEAQHIATDHYGLAARKLSTFYLWRAWQEIPLPVLLIAGVSAFFFAMRWKLTPLLVRSILLFIPAYTILLSLSPVQMDRYLLPVVVMIHALAGLGIVQWGKAGLARKNAAALALLGAVCIWAIAALILQVTYNYEGIRNDSRFALREWAMKNIPASAKVLYESRSGMILEKEKEKSPYPFALVEADDAPFQVKNLSFARANGISHIIVCSLRYDRYFDPNFYAIPGPEGAAVLQQRAFYDDLFQHGTLLWEKRPSHIIPGFTNPTVRVYALP